MNNETPYPNFATWQHENLVAFAEQTYGEWKQQKVVIDSLREDLREAMEQCRVLLRESRDVKDK